ncbi:MAG: glycosyltransferase family 4 protein [Lachnospiraceae bacterium]|nr:glycosyltransferase family 4 protein [Lachnospiraceae bacterium]
MRVLWLCNLILPEIAQALGLPSIPKEGWVAGLFDALLQREGDIRIGLCFPVSDPAHAGSGTVRPKAHPEREVSYYAFPEDTASPERYDPALEGHLKGILQSFSPDLVHCFGTEYPHTLAMARAFGRPEKLLISVQGVMDVYAERYFSNLPERVRDSVTLRDLLKRDTLRRQQEKFEIRAGFERQALSLALHHGGRTSFDRGLSERTNPHAVYHHLGETLRREFYEAAKDPEEGTPRYPHRIFVSQADYPIKGFHYLLEAAGELQKTWPDLEIAAAGQDVTGGGSLKRRILIGAYGRELKRLLRKYGLQDRVHFLGRLDAAGMIREYRTCGVYLCCSSIENSPNSLGEAMLLGTPVVAARVGGIPDMCLPEEGTLYECGADDPQDTVAEALRKALEEVFRDPDRAAAKTVPARAHARKSYDPERNVTALLDTYRSMN